MKTIIALVALTLFSPFASASLGRLFIVDSNVESRHYYINLCLVKNNTIDCEDHFIPGSEIYIRATNPLDKFPVINATIKLYYNLNVYGCIMNANQYCSFAVRHDILTRLKIG